MWHAVIKPLVELPGHAVLREAGRPGRRGGQQVLPVWRGPLSARVNRSTSKLSVALQLVNERLERDVRSLRVTR